jgi:YqzE-like protein
MDLPKEERKKKRMQRKQEKPPLLYRWFLSLFVSYFGAIRKRSVPMMETLLFKQQLAKTERLGTGMQVK